ncbi:NADPH-dependent FMN reductase [Actinocorallia populi]|uniref:NADPH-dependent FMN reductase n=1 Tax=Actinocorallia populi TaxID=2079200 RepID=UPI000D095F09|nr:NAD(P)H-dependent oxidoreductase [Actinocorallia populi]
MTRIAIITGSTRPGRRGGNVTDWVLEAAGRHRPEVTFEVLDLHDHALPHLDETAPAIFGAYERAHTLHWAEAVGAYDGFVFVVPEYNHSFPAPLKNAIDFLYAEWNDKAAGFVTYGINGGVRAAEHLRQVLAELKVATVRTQVALSIHHDFAISDPLEPGTLTPGPHQEPALTTMLDEVVAWAGALKSLRVPA